MALPGVTIELMSGGLGRVSATDDGVAGMILTGTAVEEKLVLNKHYQLSTTKDLDTLGVTAENNPLLDHEVRSFYAQAGEGSELHLLVVAEATLLTAICDPGADSPLSKLIEGAAGRIRIVGVNRLVGAEEAPETEQGIDGDAITAAAKAQQCAESYAEKIMPFRLFLPAAKWSGEVGTFKPSESSYNRVAFVLASEGELSGQYAAAVGMVLGRAA